MLGRYCRLGQSGHGQWHHEYPAESASLTGLSGTYFFNVETTNSGGATYYGTPQSFTTSVTVSKTTAGTFTLTVPAHVTSFGFTMDGAGGGGGSSDFGGTSGTAGGDGNGLRDHHDP